MIVGFVYTKLCSVVHLLQIVYIIGVDDLIKRTNAFRQPDQAKGVSVFKERNL